ncbi:MAG TPA: arginine--tRNA ligase [Xanthobacteraceae bacterium]|nr:arginine--tRNA ligase [Xanthobacteraceae bacterium]
MATKNIFADILDRVRSATADVLTGSVDQARVTVEPPRDPSHGDIATNAAMVLAKDADRKPRELAEAIAEKLRADALVAKVDVAGPGFINLTLKPDAWIAALRGAVQLGAQYGVSDIGQGELVNVEYVSANPTGPMHVGHGRGAVFGDALANLLAFAGFKVTREYYINDAGAQVDVLARSAHLRYREALGEDIGTIPEGLYPGDYLKPVGAALAAQYKDTLTKQPETAWLPVVRAKTIEMMMATVRADLAALNINHEEFFSEKSLTEGSVDKVAETIDWLRQRGYVYEGRLPPPKGAPVEDWEDREQTLFRSTEFGDDVDRPLKKSDGSYTYFASDMAYHRSKLDRGFRSLIDVWGADHAGYIKRMQAAVAALKGDSAAELDVKVVQLVKLLRAGQPVTMSKRAGEFVTLREVVDEVGRDAVRFMMLFRKNDAVLDFDLAKVIEQSRDNPVFYVQYGHARGQSIFRNARAAFPDLPDDVESLVEGAELERLSDPAELALMRQIALYPRVVEAAAAAYEPHRIAFYLFDLASEFHSLYTLGNTKPHLRFIIPNERQTTVARLVLVQGVVTVLSSGLALLGVEAPNEMR